MSLAKVRAETARRMGNDEPPSRLLPCRFCSEPTPWETLSNLGARCRTCYDAYCRQGYRPRPKAQTALPRTPGRVNVLTDHGEPASVGPEHAAESLPWSDQ